MKAFLLLAGLGLLAAAPTASAYIAQHCEGYWTADGEFHETHCVGVYYIESDEKVCHYEWYDDGTRYDQCFGLPVGGVPEPVRGAVTVRT